MTRTNKELQEDAKRSLIEHGESTEKKVILTDPVPSGTGKTKKVTLGCLAMPMAILTAAIRALF